MFIDRPAAEIEPSRAMPSSTKTLPGPNRPSSSKSMRMLRRGIAVLLAAFERHALDHGIDWPAGCQRQALHRLGGEPGQQMGATAIEPDIGLGAAAGLEGRDLGNLSREHVQRADLLRRVERQHDIAGADIGPDLGTD